ncbi:MAG: trigger factor [Sulfurimonas sp.]|nr:trigger factor [Sulfurimonas sp.]
MEIKSNKINSANAEISATILMDEVHANVEKIAKELARTTTVQGFRKGKVPVSLVKKQYGAKLLEDAEAEVLREVFAKGLKELNIENESLIGEPNISKFDKTDEKIEVNVKIAMRPEIDLGDYAAIAKEFDKPAVTDKAVDAKIVEIEQSQAPLVDIKRNRKMKLGDTAVIDFEGSIDGKVFDGGTSEAYELLLGSNQLVPGFEDQLIGVKRDEEVVVKVTFPDNYAEDLAGKEAEFKVKVMKIQVKEDVEINEELALKMLGGKEDTSVEALRTEVKTMLENEYLGKLYRDELKPALLENLVKSYEFDLPEFVVDQEIDIALNRSASSMSEEEVKALREDADKLTELRESFREDAERSVKATFIIDSLAIAQNIKIEEQEVMQTIYYEAMQKGQDPQKSYEQYKDAGHLPAIQMSMVEDRVLSTILNSKIKEA